jgi:hemoglobin
MHRQYMICESGSGGVPVTEEQLQELVERFYAKVRQDEVLGPVFNGAVEDWPEHLEKLGAFWSSVMLTTGRYKGQPMVAHLKHRSVIEPSMFDRWLGLWRETAGEVLDEAGARAVTGKAERIAESLQLGMFFKLQPRGAAA